MALTDTFVKNIKPGTAAAGEKHTDGQGLYLHVKEAGKYWRISYRFCGRANDTGARETQIYSMILPTLGSPQTLFIEVS